MEVLAQQRISAQPQEAWRNTPIETNYFHAFSGARLKGLHNLLVLNGGVGPLCHHHARTSMKVRRNHGVPCPCHDGGS